MKPLCAVVIGGYVNGYGIIRELSECGFSEIVLVDFHKSLAAYSRRIKTFYRVDSQYSQLRSILETLHATYSRLTLFPTNDASLEYLHRNQAALGAFCHLPFNSDKLESTLDKSYQYKVCQTVDIPTPRHLLITPGDSFDRVLELPFPIIIKPIKHFDPKTRVFRTIQLASQAEYLAANELLRSFQSAGFSFLASEQIPGDGSNIYAYVCYRNHARIILNEWVGKKLSQFPDEFGVFSSASNQAPRIIQEQGRGLIEALDGVGFCEPEFKYDSRDGRYKLMEVNLRPMMWSRVGPLSGVHLSYAQCLDALGQPVPTEPQINNPTHHLIYMKHELINLVSRPAYWRVFGRIVWGGARLHFTILDLQDPLPFVRDLFNTLRGVASACFHRSLSFFVKKRNSRGCIQQAS